MLRKDTGRFSRKLGVCYIVFQYAGGLLGALISYNLFKANISQPLSLVPQQECNSQGQCDTYYLWVQAIVMEIIGSCLVTFLYLTQTEEKTKLSEGDPAITTLIISSAYYAVVGYSFSVDTLTSSPFNPASSFGLFWAILFQADITHAKAIYLFFFFSYLGAILAVVLFEFVYKKAMTIVQEEEGDEEPIQEEEGLIQNNTYDQ